MEKDEYWDGKESHIECKMHSFLSQFPCDEMHFLNTKQYGSTLSGLLN